MLHLLHKEFHMIDGALNNLVEEPNDFVKQLRPLCSAGKCRRERRSGCRLRSLALPKGRSTHQAVVDPPHPPSGIVVRVPLFTGWKGYRAMVCRR